MNNYQENSLVFLAQTDTTVGFLSCDATKLSHVKQRNENQKILQVVDSFVTLKSQTRIPQKHHKLVRRSKKTTFIYPNGNSFRVVSEHSKHFNFVSKMKVIYSTSANLTKQKFDEKWARMQADIVIEDDFCEQSSSKIIKLTQRKIKKLR